MPMDPCYHVHMADDFLDFVLDQLQRLGGLHARAMFGGHGLYRNDVFFGIVADGRLYFKTDDASRAAYEQKGMRPFQATAEQVLVTYYEVPVDVLEDDTELCGWARRAVAAQERAGQTREKPRPGARRPRHERRMPRTRAPRRKR